VWSAAAITVALGLVAVEPANAQRRDGALMPQEQSGEVTAVGCLVRGDTIRGGQSGKYILARPRRGPVNSVAEERCSADSGADALTLDNPEKGKMTDAMLGRWIQISGRLERETDKNPDNLRELDVASARIVPVVIPKPPAPAQVQRAPAPRPEAVTAAAAPPPEPAPAPVAAAPAPAPAPQLPKTASEQPAVALAALLLLSTALALRAVRLRQR